MVITIAKCKYIILFCIFLFSMNFVSAALTDNLVSVWQWENNYVDTLGINNGTVNGAATITSTNCKFGNYCLDLSADNSDFITTTRTNMPTGANPRTILCWFRDTVNDGKTHSFFVYGSSSSEQLFGISNYADGNYAVTIYGSDMTTSTPGNYNNVWMMSAASYDGSRVVMYQNNTVILNATHSLNTGTTQAYFGAFPADTAHDLRGYLDDCYIWSRALSPSEITQIWNGGTGLGYPFLVKEVLINYTSPTNSNNINLTQNYIPVNVSIASSNCALKNSTISLYWTNGTLYSSNSTTYSVNTSTHYFNFTNLPYGNYNVTVNGYCSDGTTGTSGVRYFYLLNHNTTINYANIINSSTSYINDELKCNTSMYDLNYEQYINATVTWFQNISGTIVRNTTYDYNIFINQAPGSVNNISQVTTSGTGSFIGKKPKNARYLCEIIATDSTYTGYLNSSWTGPILNHIPTMNITYPINGTSFLSSVIIQYKAKDADNDNIVCSWSNNTGTKATLSSCEDITGQIWVQGVNNVTVYVNDTWGDQSNNSVFFTKQDIFFNTQVPSDITSTSLISTFVNISYNISTDINPLTVILSYKTSDKKTSIMYYTNGTPTYGYLNISYSSNSTPTTFYFDLDDNDLLPGTYNTNESMMEITAHDNDTIYGSNIILTELLNMTNRTYTFLEGMFRSNTLSAGPLNIYYCNSSYDLSSNILTNNNCALASTLNPTTVYNHTHNNGTTGHQIVTLPINALINKLASITITSRSYFIFSSNTSTIINNWLIYNVNTPPRLGSTRKSSDNGLSYTNSSYVIDTHVHQFSDQDTTLYYYGCANYTSTGVQVCDSLRSDLFQLAGLPPSNPAILLPYTGNYSKTILAYWTDSTSPNDYPITYKLSLVGNSKYNISTSSSTYNLNTSLYPDGLYYLSVFANDSQGQISDSSNTSIFRIDNTYPVLNLSSPQAGQRYNQNTQDINFTATDNIAVNCSFCLNGICNAITCNSFQYTFIDGSYNLTIISEDPAGNINSSNISIVIDTVSPTIIVNSGLTNNTNLLNPTITYYNFTLYDINLFGYNLTCVDSLTNNQEFSLEQLNLGVQTYNLVGNTTFNNYGTKNCILLVADSHTANIFDKEIVLINKEGTQTPVREDLKNIRIGPIEPPLGTIDNSASLEIGNVKLKYDDINSDIQIDRMGYDKVQDRVSPIFEYDNKMIDDLDPNQEVNMIYSIDYEGYAYIIENSKYKGHVVILNGNSLNDGYWIDAENNNNNSVVDIQQEENKIIYTITTTKEELQANNYQMKLNSIGGLNYVNVSYNFTIYNITTNVNYRSIININTSNTAILTLNVLGINATIGDININMSYNNIVTPISYMPGTNFSYNSTHISPNLNISYLNLTYNITVFNNKLNVTVQQYLLSSFINITYNISQNYVTPRTVDVGINVSSYYNISNVIISNDTVNYTYYPILCYQEFANVSTVCGGLNGGSYSFDSTSLSNYDQAIDGDYTTGITDGSYATIHMFVNYTKPNNTNSALWQVFVDGVGPITNFSLSSCFNSYPDKVVLRISTFHSGSGIPQSSVNLDCYNSTVWKSLYSNIHGGINPMEIYEEGIYWFTNNSLNNVFYNMSKNNFKQARNNITVFSTDVFNNTVNSTLAYYVYNISSNISFNTNIKNNFNVTIYYSYFNNYPTCKMLSNSSNIVCTSVTGTNNTGSVISSCNVSFDKAFENISMLPTCNDYVPVNGTSPYTITTQAPTLIFSGRNAYDNTALSFNLTTNNGITTNNYIINDNATIIMLCIPYNITTSSAGYYGSNFTIDNPCNASNPVNLTFYQSRLTIGIKSGTTGLFVNGPTVNVKNNSIIKTNIASNGTTVYYLNTGYYQINVSGGSLISNTTYSNINTGDTYLELIVFSNFTIFLKDEKTLGDFNISSPTTIQQYVYCNDSNVIVSTINTTNFTLSVGCYFQKVKYIVTYPADQYYRTILGSVFNSSVNNVTVFLVNLDNTQVIFNTFQLYTLINNYINPKLYFTKNINGINYVITSDDFNVETKVGTYLMYGEQYNIIMVADNYPAASLGFYTADSAGEKLIRLFNIDINANPTAVWLNNTFYATVDNSTNTKRLKLAYEGYNVQSVVLNIYNETTDSTPIHTATLTSNDGIFFYTPADYAANYTFKVRMNMTLQNNQVYTYSTDMRLDDRTILDIVFQGYITPTFFAWFLAILMATIALLFTVRTADIGGFIFLGLGGLFSFLGWVVIANITFGLALMIAILSFLKDKDMGR